MVSKFPSGTVTFLFTDIEGSTQWWEEQPAWMGRAFARQEAILRSVAEAHGGYVYKMIGDAFQIAFETGLSALNAAVEAQRLLQTEDWGEYGPLRVRMAIHTGVTEEREDDYVGPVLNRLGRLLSASHGGQILLTQTTHELVQDWLPPDISLNDLGQHRLKDLVRSEHIYQAVAPGLISSFPPIRTLDAFAHNLPLQLTSFIGREKEILQVKRLLLGDRFVTLTGPGGTGKTRLAVQTGADLLELFPDGVWLVELASLADPTLVPKTNASTLDVRESAGRQVTTLLMDYLQNKEMLLILDNCEHLLSACAEIVTTLLQACPNLSIIATSREALDIPGEMTLRVPSLSVPDVRQTPRAETLTQYESIQLFVERAGAIQPDFALTDANAFAIAQICHRLDGIPLAIELAVARVKMMPVEQVIRRLDNRFRLLTGGSRTALPRHQTLRALIDWSYDLLSEMERVLFQRLSVFAGGWTLEAAERICQGDEIQRDDILDLLTQLINKSLVIPDQDEDAEARYQFLETIRQYARERLLEAGGGESIRDQHLSYYVEISERAEPELRGPNQIEWLDRLDQEVDNIRASLEWALEANIEAGLRIASALLWFWHIRSGKSEGIDWLERMLAADLQACAGVPSSPARALLRGKALNAAGTLMIMHGNVDRARELSEESLKLHEELGPSGRGGTAHALWNEELGPSGESGIAHALWNLAQGASYHEDLEASQAMAERSLALYRELGDKFGVAQCLDHLGSYALIRGHYSQARQLWEEDLALRREIGDKDGIAWSLSLLANLAMWQGDQEQAWALYNQSHQAFQEVSNKWAASVALSGMGSVMLLKGDFERAAKLYEEALAYGRDTGDQNTIAGRRYDLARVAWSRGEYAAARSYFREALKIFQQMPNPWNGTYFLEAVSALVVAEGEMERAARLFGATDIYYSHLQFLLSPLERQIHERDLAAARAALGEETFSLYRAEGRAMTIEQAMEEALGKRAES